MCVNACALRRAVCMMQLIHRYIAVLYIKSFGVQKTKERERASEQSEERDQKILFLYKYNPSGGLA